MEDQKLMSLLENVRFDFKVMLNLFWMDYRHESWRRRIIIKLVSVRDTINDFLENDEEAQQVIRDIT